MIEKQLERIAAALECIADHLVRQPEAAGFTSTGEPVFTTDSNPRLSREESNRIGREVHEEFAAVREETRRAGEELNELSRLRARKQKL